MSTATPPPPFAPEQTPRVWTARDLATLFGPIPLDRVRSAPPPGTATYDDWLAEVTRVGKPLIELVDGVLVEKAMSWEASEVGLELAAFLRTFLRGKRLGKLLGADGGLRLAPGRVRIPDISFLDVETVTRSVRSGVAYPETGPTLAVEVLSPSNTREEMTQKTSQYFEAGAKAVWLVDPIARTVEIHTAPSISLTLRETDTLDGGDVLPGFALPLKTLFAVLDAGDEDPSSPA